MTPLRAHQLATRVAPSESPETVARRAALQEMLAELTPRAQLTAAAKADRAAVETMLATWDTLTVAQLQAILKRLVRYLLVERRL